MFSPVTLQQGRPYLVVWVGRGVRVGGGQVGHGGLHRGVEDAAQPRPGQPRHLCNLKKFNRAQGQSKVVSTIQSLSPYCVGQPGSKPPPREPGCESFTGQWCSTNERCGLAGLYTIRRSPQPTVTLIHQMRKYLVQSPSSASVGAPAGNGG